MKNFLKIIPVLMLMVVMASCKKKDELKITDLTLSIDKIKILDDNMDAAIVTVENQDGRDVTDEVDIFVEGVLISGISVSYDEPASIEVHAEYDEISSNSVSVSVVADEGFRYNRVILLEQFTATWCGWCPEAIGNINELLIVNQEIAHVAYHLDDEFSYSYNMSLIESFGLNAIPSVVAGREILWDYSTTQIDELHRPVRAGLTVSYGGDISGIDIDVDVEFGKLFAQPVSLSVYLIEDDLVADQENYLNHDPSSPWFEMGDVLFGFSHDNVMIKTVTDMFGDVIPAENIDIGTLYQKSFNTSASDLTDINKSSIVAFVSYALNDNVNIVVNAIVCNYGETVESSLFVESK